jgi:hypothetical protein
VLLERLEHLERLVLLEDLVVLLFLDLLMNLRQLKRRLISQSLYHK